MIFQLYSDGTTVVQTPNLVCCPVRTPLINFGDVPSLGWVRRWKFDDILLLPARNIHRGHLMFEPFCSSGFWSVCLYVLPSSFHKSAIFEGKMAIKLPILGLRVANFTVYIDLRWSVCQMWILDTLP